MIAPNRSSRAPRPRKLSYTVQEFAAISGIGLSTLYRSIRNKTCDAPVVRAGTAYRIPAWWVNETFRPDRQEGA